MKSRKLLILLIIFLVVGIALLALLPKDGDTATSESAGDTAQTDSSLSLWAIDAASISRLSWAGEKGSMTLVQQSDGWVWDADRTQAVAQESVAALTTPLAAVTASRQLDADALTEFSLDPPVMSITLTLPEQELTIDLGMRNTVYDQNYALYDGKLYLLETDLYTAFDISPYSLLAVSALPDIAVEDITALGIQSEVSTLELCQPENPGQYTYSDQYVWFTPEADGYTALSEAKTKSLLGSILGLELSSPVSSTLDASAGELNAAATVAVSYLDPATLEAGAFTLCFARLPEAAAVDIGLDGDPASMTEEPVSVWLEGGTMVYSVPADTVCDILYTSAASLVPNDICAIDLTELKALVFVLEGQEYRIDVSAQNTETIDADGNAVTSTAYTYVLNGEPLADGVAEVLYTTLTGLTVEGAADASSLSPEDAPLQVRLYRDREAYAVMTLSLIPYDGSFYVVDFAGEQRLLVSFRAVDALIAAIREAVA